MKNNYIILSALAMITSLCIHSNTHAAASRFSRLAPAFRRGFTPRTAPTRTSNLAAEPFAGGFRIFNPATQRALSGSASRIIGRTPGAQLGLQGIRQQTQAYQARTGSMPTFGQYMQYLSSPAFLQQRGFAASTTPQNWLSGLFGKKEQATQAPASIFPQKTEQRPINLAEINKKIQSSTQLDKQDINQLLAMANIDPSSKKGIEASFALSKLTGSLKDFSVDKNAPYKLTTNELVNKIDTIDRAASTLASMDFATSHLLEDLREKTKLVQIMKNLNLNPKDLQAQLSSLTEKILNDQNDQEKNIPTIKNFSIEFNQYGGPQIMPVSEKISDLVTTTNEQRELVLEKLKQKRQELLKNFTKTQFKEEITSRSSYNEAVDDLANIYKANPTAAETIAENGPVQLKKILAFLKSNTPIDTIKVLGEEEILRSKEHVINPINVKF